MLPTILAPSASNRWRNTLLLEGGVECDRAWWEVVLLDQGAGLGGTKLAIHTAIFPLDREWALVADPRQRAEDWIPLRIAMPWRDKIPAAAGIAEVEVRAEDAVAAIDIDAAILDVHVVDAIAECLDKGHRIEELVDQVAGIEVDPKGRPPPNRGQGLLSGGDVVGDLGRVDFESELDTNFIEDVEDRVPAIGEILVAGLDCCRIVGREGVDHVPDR